MQPYEVMRSPRTCHVCGKEFIPIFPRNWRFKIKHHNRMYYFCSYHCFKKGKEDLYADH